MARWRLVAWTAVIALAAVACDGGEEGGSRVDRPRRTSREDGGDRTRRPRRTSRIRLERIATLEQPLGMAVRRGHDALYIAQKTGAVVAIRAGRVDPRPILDLSGEVSQGSEQGLLGLVFSGDGKRLYTNHTDPEGDTRITEWQMRDGQADPGSRREVMRVDQPFGNHNGGNLAFGPDGYLYIGLGDGGSAGDPQGNAQSLKTLLGKMLRIDPRPGRNAAYRIPRDNPFTDGERGRPEIWAFGLRNPWRYSFDRDSGDLWIADVGQSDREEINRQPADSEGGENYGWNRLEGTKPYVGNAPGDAVPPLYEYGRDLGGTVIGGYVYRGTSISGLAGDYVFGDFFDPALRALTPGEGEVRVRKLGIDVDDLVAFGQDASGELYALSLSGPIFRIVAG